MRDSLAAETISEATRTPGRKAAGSRLVGTVLRLTCNWRYVEEDVALSGQGLRLPFRTLLETEGMRAVINLRGANTAESWYRGELTDCARLGIAHHDVRLSARRLPERGTLLGLVDAFDALERPMLMKCAAGIDRSVFAASLYRLHRQDADATAPARRGRLQASRQPWIRAFPAFYEESRRGHGLRDWIVDVYSAATFEAFLTARGLPGGARVGRRQALALEPAE